MAWAVVNWVHARPWRAGWLLAGAVSCSLIAPAAGLAASVLVGPLVAFVVGYDLWWFLRGWKRAAVLAVAVAWPVAGWALSGVVLGSFSTAAYMLTSGATALALLAGYRWGRHREEQERGGRLARGR
jgi:hypothetical protein